MEVFISIHKALAGLDGEVQAVIVPRQLISIHKALAGLDGEVQAVIVPGQLISIHKALAGLDQVIQHRIVLLCISIHKALAGLDADRILNHIIRQNFNPQGPRGPRHFL